MKILMIEDNESVTEMMGMFFEKEGFEPVFYQDGLKGYQAFEADPDQWDLAILDINLPGMDGITICRKMRAITKTLPIIMLTAQDSESDQVIGLEMGADDYVTKPFSPLTLLARIKALHRRAHLAPNPGSADGQNEDFDVITDTVKINTVNREAYYGDKKIENLTPKEFDLLLMFASHPKRVFSRDHLLKTLWEDPFYGDERTVDAHIKKLRQKIEIVGPQVIQTVWGVGYKFDEAGQ